MRSMPPDITNRRSPTLIPASSPACPGSISQVVGDREGVRSRSFISVLLLFVLLAVFFTAQGAESAVTIRRDEFISLLFNARGFPLPSGERSSVNAAFDYNLVPLSDGKLSEPISRLEAVVYAVHCLGMLFEPRALSGCPLPFNDIGSLRPEERGALAAALNMRPALLKKSGSSFDPTRRLSPAEAKEMANNVRQATKGFVLSVDLSLYKGMTVRVRREGACLLLPKWRAVVNGFDTKEEADSFRELLASSGVEAIVDSYNYDWRVRSPLFDKYGGIRAFLAAASYHGREGVVFSSLPSWENSDTPRFWTMMIFDPGLFEIRPILPDEGLQALVPLSSMFRDGAVAAVNGGFFSTSGKGRGSPIGALMIDGTLASAPIAGRTCMGWNDENRAVFGELSWSGRVYLSGGYMDLNAINRQLKGDGVALFSSHFGRNTPPTGLRVGEAVLERERVREIRTGGGNPIPEGGIVLAVYGPAARFIEALGPDDTIWMTNNLNESDPSWQGMSQIVQGGPFLLSNGEILSGREKLNESFTDRRHPRTAVGLTRDGRWFFFVGDGRNALHSVGYTLDELSRVLKEAGALYALNLDGGGSSEIMTEKGLWNVLSDGLERPVSYGLGAFKREAVVQGW